MTEQERLEKIKTLTEKRIKDGMEYRSMTVTAVEPDEGEENKYIVEGYATTFNEPYLLLDNGDCRIYEVVEPGAFDKCDMHDVIMQYDHCGRVFARTRNNTLMLTPDNHGLFQRGFLGGTTIGHQLWEEVRGGYTDRMSMRFIVSDDTYEDRTENGITIVTRHITGISRLFDVSAVSIPANDGTLISARSLCDGILAEVDAERRRIEARRKLELKLKLWEV